MGIPGWLFGKKPTPEHEASGAHAEEQISDSGSLPDFLELRSRSFFGPCSRSPNERYTLAWRDGDDSGTRGGARLSGSGRYILFENKKIIAEGRMARPNDGKVANNGVCILNDWE